MFNFRSPQRTLSDIFPKARENVWHIGGKDIAVLGQKFVWVVFDINGTPMTLWYLEANAKFAARAHLGYYELIQVK